MFETFFVKVFLPTVGHKRPILLVYDGHSTHVGCNIVEKAREVGITIMKIPPHISDNLQPLDLAVNKSFKDKWDPIFKTDDPKVCIAGFRKAGIFPFNSNAIPEEKFHPDQLAEWKKKQEHSSGLNETSTTPNISKTIESQLRATVDQPFSDFSYSKNQLTLLHQTEIWPGSNVVVANDPDPIWIPSLRSICLNYWNYANERTTTVQDHTTEVTPISYDRYASPSYITDMPQSSADFTFNLEMSQQNEHHQNNKILQPITCTATNFKRVTLDHDLFANNAKTASLKSSKVIIVDDRPVKSHITFEELLLRKIKAGAHSKQKRTKVAAGAEIITSEDVYKKQRNIEEKIKN